MFEVEKYKEINFILMRILYLNMEITRIFFNFNDKILIHLWLSMKISMKLFLKSLVLDMFETD